jgi:hypothetical protein
VKMRSMRWGAHSRVADALPGDTQRPEAMSYPHDAESS